MFTKAIASLAIVATLATGATFAMPTAEAEAAGGRRTAFAVGAITGLAIGAIATHRHRTYVHHVPAPAYYGRPAPWTAAWYDYCSARYRSFNPRTGYFVTYSGHRRFCR